MQKPLLVLLAFLFFVFIPKMNAQLGFCNGNSGDPIFTETFGTGTQNGPPLPPGTTNYTYVDGEPDDGSYTISSRTNYFDWFDTTDHTPGDTNGKSLIVNASFTAGEFFRRTVSGLCENTSYEFSSWIMNLHPSTSTVCQPQGIPVNLKFQIWDNTDTQLLATGDTGDIFDKASPIWEQYALVFQTLPGQTSVILKMLNNGTGGCGNDLAIDDIVFKSCGDNILLADSTNSSSITVCENQAPIATTLTASPDFSVFQTHAYQWQESTDGINWSDIAGETTPLFTTPQLNTSTFYRVKVAEDAINLANSSCSVVSDVFHINIVGIPDAPVSQGDVELCVNNAGGVQVSVPNDVQVNWYDAPTGGNLLVEDSAVYATTISGTYYAEAVTRTANCISNARTPVSIAYFDLPVVEDESLTFCEAQPIMLSGDVPNASYLWNTGETTREIMVASPGTYSVVVTNGNGCSVTKTIQLSQIDNPIIDKVVSDHRDLTILTLNSGDFEYSLNGLLYQETPFFENLRGGVYDVFVREKSGCGVAQLQFVHIVVPRFFTPNGDGINDSFSAEGVEFVDDFRISIFDRTSRLLAQSTDKSFSWDGMLNNRPLPASNYWYRIEIGPNILTGNFALKR